MKSTRNLRLRLRLMEGALLLLLVVGTTAAVSTHQLLLDAANHPSSDFDLTSTHVVGTLDSARLSANVPLLDGSGNLTLNTPGGSPYARFSSDGDLGLTITDGWGQSIDVNSDNYGLMLNAMPLTLNGGGIYDQQFGGYVYLPGGMLGALDARNLINVPPPAGLSIDDPQTGTIATGNTTPGDLSVGGTAILSSPDTLGPLDGSALTFYGQDIGSLISNANVSSANYANYAQNAFNEFFYNGGHNTDTSLPGDGTFSLMNGQFTGDGTNIALPNMGTGDPHVAGQLYQDAVTHAVFISQG